MAEDTLQHVLSFIYDQSLKIHLVCKSWRNAISRIKQQRDRMFQRKDICPADVLLPTKSGFEFGYVIDPSRDILTEEETLKKYQGPFNNPNEAWRSFETMNWAIDDEEQSDTMWE
eukprot:801700_1